MIPSPAKSLCALVGVLLLAPLSQGSGVLWDNGVSTKNLTGASGGNTSVAVAFDGTFYWAVRGGSASGDTLIQFDALGAYVATYQTGVDHRSVFTDASNNLFTTDYGGNGIQVHQYVNGAPTLLYTLGSTPDTQMEFGLRDSNSSLYGHSKGTVYEFDFATGTQIGSFPLTGYSDGYPANVQFAVTDSYLLTYDSAGNVDAWDYTGANVGTCNIGLTSFTQIFSFSFADGLLWIQSAPNSVWDGFDIGLGDAAAWSNYGQGFPGTQGVPALVASNPPVLGQPITVTADNSNGASRIGGFLVIGLQQLSLPGNWGGDLLASPDLFQPVSIPVSGLVLSSTLPNDQTLVGTSVYLQVLEFDAGAAAGISNTPGLELVLGN